MLSATPHDGKPESFASLMNMLDATAIANEKEYEHEDFSDKGLVVRRFKKDVKDQIAKDFLKGNIIIIILSSQDLTRKWKRLIKTLNLCWREREKL